jgi:hypothetical protein
LRVTAATQRIHEALAEVKLMRRTPEQIKRAFPENQDVTPTVRAHRRTYYLIEAKLESETAIVTYSLEKPNAVI